MIIITDIMFLMTPLLVIMSLIYVERLVKRTNGALMPNVENWRSILFGCMVLASKVWDDLSMLNADFCFSVIWATSQNPTHHAPGGGATTPNSPKDNSK